VKLQGDLVLARGALGHAVQRDLEHCAVVDVKRQLRTWGR
jgi:hypothetical protein